MRPAHAKPNAVARVARRLAGWRPGFAVHKPAFAGKLGLRNKHGPLSRKLQQAAPASHIPGPLYQRPQALVQVRAAGPPRQAFPCSPHSPSELTALPRCLILFCLALCHTQRLLSAPSPLLRYIPRRCCFASGTRISSHACMRAAALRSPTPPRYSNTTVQAQMPVWISFCSTSNTDSCFFPRTDTLL